MNPLATIDEVQLTTEDGAEGPSGILVDAGPVDGDIVAPTGFRTLAAGVLRKIRVNRKYVNYGAGNAEILPWIVEGPSFCENFAEVIIPGAVQLKTERTSPEACGSAWLQTDGVIFVK